MDELEPYLRACGMDVKRASKANTGDGIRISVKEANDWGADLYYVAHTNAGGGCRNGIMIYSEDSRRGRRNCGSDGWRYIPGAPTSV